MVALAKQAGFTLAEIRLILAGFSERTPPSDVWRRLAARKLPEVERTLTQAKAMKGILEAGLRCECLSLGECLGRIGRRRGAHLESHSATRVASARDERSPVSRISAAASAIAATAVQASLPPRLILCAPASAISATERPGMGSH